MGLCNEGGFQRPWYNCLDSSLLLVIVYYVQSSTLRYKVHSWTVCYIVQMEDTDGCLIRPPADLWHTTFGDTRKSANMVPDEPT